MQKGGWLLVWGMAWAVGAGAQVQGEKLVSAEETRGIAVEMVRAYEQGGARRMRDIEQGCWKQVPPGHERSIARCGIYSIAGSMVDSMFAISERRRRTVYWHPDEVSGRLLDRSRLLGLNEQQVNHVLGAEVLAQTWTVMRGIREAGY